MTDFFQVRGLSKYYNGIPAVDDLSFSIDRQEIVGLVGPNGSGKSTTIDCLTHFLTADAGTWTLEGGDLSRISPYRIAHSGVRRTFQAVPAYDRLSVFDNLMAAAQELDGTAWMASLFRTNGARVADSALAERCRELLDTVGLTHVADLPAGFLSYGQRKLLSIASALITTPQIAFLDEPVAGVNPSMILKIEELLKVFNERGVTLVVVDHNMEFIMHLCHRVIVLDLGSKIADGPPSVIRADKRVLEAYMGGAETGAL
jgi:branched-chain amino acid transport system ATP-binding protein